MNSASTPQRMDPNLPATPQESGHHHQEQQWDRLVANTITTPQKAMHRAVNLLIDLLPLIGGNSSRLNINNNSRRDRRLDQGFDESQLETYEFHKACCNDSTSSIAQLHLMLQEDRNRIYDITQETGDSPLHIACRFNAVDVVDYLLQVDSKSAGLKKPRLITQPAHNGSLPIHISAEQGNTECIRRLLQACDNKNDLLMAKTGDGSTPLHLALLNTHDIPVIRLLLSPEALKEPDDENNLPLHLALQSKLGMPLWRVLLDADEGRETLLWLNDEAMTPFKFFLQHSFKLDDGFIDKYLSQIILSKFLEGQRLKYFDLKLHRIVAHNAEMQAVLNQACSDRLPVITFVMDFYAHTASLITLFILTENHLGLQDGYRTCVSMLYFLAGYFILREIIQLLSARRLYWNDTWNYADLGRIAMILVLAHTVERIELFKQNVDEGFVRRIFLTVAVFMYIGAISFLRATFLPFALFVGGTSAIVVTLIPFLVGFALALACMAYGFWVSGFEENNDSIPFNSYSEWLFGALIAAMSGPSEFSDIEDGYISRFWWTTIFIIIIQVIFLNVLIAIISSEWERITSRQAEVFWRYRLEFVSGVIPAEKFLAKCFPSRLKDAVHVYDKSLDNMRFIDRIEWDVFPYLEVLKDTSLYWNRKEFIERLNSLDRSEQQPEEDWETKLGQYRSIQADYFFARNFLEVASTFLRLLLCAMWWMISLLLGCVTCGILWPRRARLFLFGPSSKSWSFSKADNEARAMKENQERDHTFTTSLNGKLDSMNERINELHMAIDNLTKVVTLSAKRENMDPGDGSNDQLKRRKSTGLEELFASQTSLP